MAFLCRQLGICVVISLFACLYADQGCVDFDLEAELPNITTAKELKIKKSDFPIDFAFGVATAAAQIEGAANEGGRGPSIWDNFVQRFPEKISDHNRFSSSIDHYKRYNEDVKDIKNLGVDYYRFSISWTRIFPKGSLGGGVNQEGIDHYNSLINELIKDGIKPFVTLFHFDSPQVLEEKYGGPLNRSFVHDFKDYSELCFRTFGDRVKNWVTINEPFIIAAMGYDLGVAAPGRCSKPFSTCPEGNSATEPYIVAHNLLLAHATVVNLYREKFKGKQGGEIGISHVGQYVEPFSESPKDKAAATRALDFSLGWFVEPLVHGDYPAIMKDLVKDRLPSFTKEEKKFVKGSFDFIGINYYTTRYGQDIPENPNAPVHYFGDSLTNITYEKDGVPIGPQAEGSGFLYIYPQGLEKLLKFMKRKYKSPKIYISENGITEKKVENRKLEDALKDPHRVNNILRHLYYIHKAIKNGVNVKGYIYWTLFDDFEWAEGFTPRFGLYYVDYKDNLKRIPKLSAKWFHSFLRGA
ncbi:putative Beta-glucosidase [Quillaja saponaria]|uniref:Beta-glucosidase n=1 Tax=Quillaja saponaria TaxID=32244 RepID=A0AAD7LFB1_QUISA|nr:putative Beta-glucosidase [Quillaja saponaria]